tara:strand:- start:3441 stop:3965 length:525 start_codon:yes stop_codon:yes gene_type:complete
MAQFDRPVAGQSLTAPPKGAAYERPPEITSPEKAFEAHIKNVSRGEAIEDVIFLTSQGLDIKSLTEGLLRSAVAEGIHSIDVSLILAPILHEFIKGRLDVLDVTYEEGIDNKKQTEEIRYQRDYVLNKQMMDDIMLDEGDSTPDPMSLEDTQVMPSEPTIEQEPPQQGLMTRTG